MAKKCGCQGAVSVSTNDFSRKIFDNVGMETLRKKNWDEFVIDGKKVFEDVKSAFCASHFIAIK